MEFKELLKSADWKNEKHVPVIDIEKKGENTEISVSVGKEIQHPNTTEHHICWIEVYLLPKDEKFPYLIARSEFGAHGASVQGANSSTVYTQPEVKLSFKTEKAGTLYALSYCNIHGVWTNSVELEI